VNESELRSQLERYHTDASGWALHCCRQRRADAEDVLQATYVSVLEGTARFDGRSTFRTWLFAVIRRTAAAQWRSAWLRALVLEREAGRFAVEPPPPASDEAERSERAARLRDALQQLSTRQQSVLHLVFYQGLTVEEAAQVMAVSIGSARTHYARGKARLAELLGRALSP
jgi:RNA polymerase sigma factor (sigma-70 family)